MLRSAACIAALLTVSACVVITPEPQPVTENACGAAQLQNLVGRSARVLETIRFSTEVRIIRPGTAVTMDYNPARLNIAINTREVITSVYCS